MKATRLVVATMLMASVAVFADTPINAVRKLARLPSNRCKTSPCLVGDPVLVSSHNAISYDRGTDATIAMPNGVFKFDRVWVSDVSALGITDEVVAPSLPTMCQQPVRASMLEAFGDERYLHSLQAAVDTRCGTHTRVLTPDGDVRFFGLFTEPSEGASAWVPRATGEGQGEPSRLKVTKVGGMLRFEWFSEAGPSYVFSQHPFGLADVGLVRMTEARNAEATTLYTVAYGQVCGLTEPMVVTFAESYYSVVNLDYVGCALSAVRATAFGTSRTLVTYSGPLATFAEGATAGGWVDSIGSDSYRQSIFDLPEEVLENAGIPFGPLKQMRQYHSGYFPPASLTDYPYVNTSQEGFRIGGWLWGGAVPTSFGPMQTDAGLTFGPEGTQCGQSTGQRLTSTTVAGGTASSRRIFFRGGVDDHQTTGLPAEYAPLPARVAKQCSGYSDPWLCSPGNTDFFYGIVSDGVTFSPTCSNPSQTVRLGAVRDPQGAVEVFPTAYTSASGGNFEGRASYFGASTLTGTDALHTKWRTFGYANDRQQVVTEEEPSALPTSPGQRATTTRQYDSTGRLLATVRTGNTRDPGSGAIVTRHRAIFYRYGARCSGWTEGIPRRRVSSVEGPCEVASPTATSCGPGQPAWAVTDLYYYDYANGSVGGALIQNPYDAHNDGRLGATRFFPNGCSGSYLQTQWGSYTAEGKPELVINPDGTVESSTSSGQLTTYSSGRAPALGTALALQWDMGRLQKATHDNGEYWRACYGRASRAAPPEAVAPESQAVSFPMCPKSRDPYWSAPSTVMDKPLWVGRFSPNGTPLEHYRFFYSADDRLARVEFYSDPPTNSLDWLTKLVWWRDIKTDSERRVVASVLGGKIPSLVRRDSRGDVALLGSGFDFANPLMPSAIPYSCDGQGGWLCRQLAIDRLHRPTAITFPYLGGNADSQDCLAYDGQGNVSVYAPGCAPGTCAANPPPTTVSVQAGALSVVGGPTCSATPVWYVHDDFGNLVSVTQTHGSTQSETRFDFDGRNALVQRQTAAQRASNANAKTTFTTDAIGRTLLVQEVQADGGTPTLVTYAHDVAPALPTNCATAFGSITYGTGRLVYESNPLWKTWNSYDSLGNLKAQLRLSTSHADCGTVRQDQNWNITRYSYGYRGRLEEVQYPFGRRVRYVYPSSTAGETRRLDLPSGIDVEVFQSETSSSFVRFLDNIAWSRDGLLSSYRAYTYQSRPGGSSLPTYKHTVSYDYAGGSDIETPPASCSASVAGGSDGTRRLRRIRTVTDNWGRTLDQWYTWIADQVVSVDRCYYGQSTPLNEYRRETGERGFDAKGQLTDTTVVTSGGGLTDSGRFFAYDSRGNRVRLGNHSTLPAAGFSNTHIGDELVSAQAATVTASGATVDSTSRAHTSFSYDQDGRTTTRSAANDTTGLPNWQTSYTFPYGAGATNGGYDSIIRAVTVGGLAYNYYYDGSNRRIRKSYPVVGATDDFFYDSAGRLVSERGFTFDINSNGNTVDEYVYLNGHAVGMLRSVFSGAMQRYGDWDGYADPTNGAQCQRRAQEGRCGWYWLNPDRLGRPTMVVDKNHRHDGFGEYDVFGMPNRVVRRSETPHPYAANSTYTVATQQTREKFYYRLLARARFDFYESKSRIYSCGQFVFCTSEDILQVAEPGYTPVFQIGATRGALVTPWFAIQSTAGFNVTFTTDASKQGDGVVFSGWDYQRIDPVPTGTTKAMLVFPALRAPGQYHDEETGLFENNNRYHDSSLGRYLSPEPLLQSPAYVRRMAENGLSVPTYAYANNNPLRYVDPNGLETQVVVTGGNWPGSHAAIRVDNGGSGVPVLFDPGGSYGGASRPSGGFFEGDDASIGKFAGYHSRGEPVLVLRFQTTPEEEAAIADRFGYSSAAGPSDVAPGLCANTVSSAVSGIGPFKAVEPVMLPASLAQKIFPTASSWSVYAPGPMDLRVGNLRIRRVR